MSMSDDPRDADAPARTDGADPVMSDHITDEVLAVYVDGAASPQEAASVERHLAECPACRTEVDTAAGAMTALMAVPEVDSPWSERGVDPLVAAAVTPAAAPAVSIRERRGTRVAWQGTAAAALAAAAVLTGVVVLLAHGTGSGGHAESLAQPTAAAKGGLPIYSQDDLLNLTRSLAQSAGSGTAFGPETEAPTGASSGAAVGGATSPASPQRGPVAIQTPLASDAVGGIPCARRASAQPVSAVAIYAQTALFDGKRVWVIGFVSESAPGSSANLELVAVTTDNCSVAFLTRQPIAS
jgi:hypothetical protein